MIVKNNTQKTSVPAIISIWMNATNAKDNKLGKGCDFNEIWSKRPKYVPSQANKRLAVSIEPNDGITLRNGLSNGCVIFTTA